MPASLTERRVRDLIRQLLPNVVQPDAPEQVLVVGAADVTFSPGETIAAVNVQAAVEEVAADAAADATTKADAARAASQPYSAILTATTASFLLADETKLDGIEAGATADQTATEILVAIKTVDGVGSGLDADLLDGLSSAAFETPAGAQGKANAKVTQTITNGVTTTAPSEDAVFDALALKVDLATLGTYVSYVPTVAQNGARTTSGVVARYTQIGKMVYVYGKATITNAGAAASTLTVTVPVPALAADRFVGNGWISDLSATDQWTVACRLASTTTLDFYATSATNLSAWGVNPSLAVANGDVIYWSATYEAA